MIDKLKQWVMVVGSGKVEHVDCLVQVNIAQKGGLQVVASSALLVAGKDFQI